VTSATTNNEGVKQKIVFLSFSKRFLQGRTQKQAKPATGAPEWREEEKGWKSASRQGRKANHKHKQQRGAREGGIMGARDS
jgi:hypothetical protein